MALIVSEQLVTLESNLGDLGLEHRYIFVLFLVQLRKTGSKLFGAVELLGELAVPLHQFLKRRAAVTLSLDNFSEVIALALERSDTLSEFVDLNL